MANPSPLAFLKEQQDQLNAQAKEPFDPVGELTRNLESMYKTVSGIPSNVKRFVQDPVAYAKSLPAPTPEQLMGMLSPAHIGGIGMAGVIKPKGGNWFSGNIEHNLKGLRQRTGVGSDPAETLAEMHKVWTPEAIEKVAETQPHVRELIPEQKAQLQNQVHLNNWIDKNLTNYVKNQLGTPEDPVRLAIDSRVNEAKAKHKEDMERANRVAQRAKEETDPRRQANFQREANRLTNEANDDLNLNIKHASHVTNDINDLTHEDLKALGDIREKQGFPAEGFAKSPEAKGWERYADLAINTKKASRIQEAPSLYAKVEEARLEKSKAENDLNEKFAQYLRDKPANFNESQITNITHGMGFEDKERLIGDDTYSKAWEKYQKLESIDDNYNRRLAKENPWISKVAPDTNIYSAQTGNLGFDHIVDVLKEHLANGTLRPEDLKNTSVEQAVRKTADYNLDKAKKMAEAQFKVTEGMPVHKEYPEGYKWIELTAPKKELPSGWSVKEALNPMSGKQFQVFDENGSPIVGAYGKTEESALNSATKQLGRPELEKALQYEGETMGHCVGSYCPDVLEGRSRIFSLRDVKGEPHVTVEVEPTNALAGHANLSNEQKQELHNQVVAQHYGGQEPDLKDAFNDLANYYKHPFVQRIGEAYTEKYGSPPSNIIQIKGKGNARPVSKYDPFTQDFVRSGNWGDVGDLQNTGLVEQHSLDRQIAKDQFGLNLPRFTTPQESKDYMGLDVDRYHNGAENLKIPESLLKYKTQPETTPKVPSEVSPIAPTVPPETPPETPPITPPETPRYKKGGAVLKFAQGGIVDTSDIQPIQEKPMSPLQQTMAKLNPPVPQQTDMSDPVGNIMSNLKGMGNTLMEIPSNIARFAKDPVQYTKDLPKPTPEQMALAFSGGALGGMTKGVAGMAKAPMEAGPSIKNFSQAFDDAIKHHLSLPYEDRVTNSLLADNAVADYVGRDIKGKSKPLLTANAKLKKTMEGVNGEEPITLPDGRTVENTGLALSPAYEEGKFQMCPNSASCAESCLGKTSGNYFKLGGGNDLDALKGPRLNSFNKTQALMNDPHSFAVKLHDEIQSAKTEADKNGSALAVRLNVLSDINPRVHKAIIEAHPDVAFYDYTKNNTNPIAPNHHYTYSSTGVEQPSNVSGLPFDVPNSNQNWNQMRKRLDTGSNVAMAFSHKSAIPKRVFDQETGKHYTVISGDDHDFRPLDQVPKGSDGVIIGLKNKSANSGNMNATEKSKGFMVHYDPKFKAEGPRLARDENGKPIPTNDLVTIAKQNRGQITLNNDGGISK